MISNLRLRGHVTQFSVTQGIHLDEFQTFSTDCLTSSFLKPRCIVHHRREFKQVMHMTWILRVSDIINRTECKSHIRRRLHEKFCFLQKSNSIISYKYLTTVCKFTTGSYPAYIPVNQFQCHFATRGCTTTVLFKMRCRSNGMEEGACARTWALCD